MERISATLGLAHVLNRHGTFASDQGLNWSGSCSTPISEADLRSYSQNVGLIGKVVRLGIEGFLGGVDPDFEAIALLGGYLDRDVIVLALS